MVMVTKSVVPSKFYMKNLSWTLQAAALTDLRHDLRTTYFLLLIVQKHFAVVIYCGNSI